MVCIFKYHNPYFGIFLRALEWKFSNTLRPFVIFWAISYILYHLVYLWPFGIHINGHLVYLWPFGIFLAIWYVVPRKIWQP
jgi:hypothetical protein